MVAELSYANPKGSSDGAGQLGGPRLAAARSRQSTTAFGEHDGLVETDLLLACRAALHGAAVARRYFDEHRDLVKELKADGSLVTKADREVEAAVKAVLTEARPHDAVLGEEAGQSGQAARRWLIDPIDGTAQFVAGDDRWLVLVALEEADQVVVGVAVVPAQEHIWWAERGSGAFEADLSQGRVGKARRLRTAGARASELAEARLGVVPSEDNLFLADYRVIAQLTAVTEPRPWSTHAALLVARGELDLAVQTRGAVWDFASTSLIVTEAGGKYSGLDGDETPKAGVALFSASAQLHAKAFERLRMPQYE